MEVDASPPCCRVVLISELVEAACDEESEGTLDGLSVRVLGQLAEYDVHTGKATLGLHGFEIIVDTSMVADNVFRNESFYQVFGELAHQRTGDSMDITLRARVAMNVDGIDVPLFERALRMRRKYEEDRGAPQAPLLCRAA